MYTPIITLSFSINDLPFSSITSYIFDLSKFLLISLDLVYLLK